MPTLSGFRENKKNIPSSNNVLPRKNASPCTISNSFAAILKSGSVNHNTVTGSSPAIVLDDACIVERDFSCSLMGKMKDINALSNLFIILVNEGFENVKLFYLGGQWVLLELDSVTSKEKITNHVGVGSWFEVLKWACNSFVCEERLVWVAIEGLPVKALTRNTYAKIIASWGELVDINESDNCSLSCIRVCVRTKPRVLINDRVKIIIKGQLHWICVKEQEAWMPEFKTVMEDDTSSDEESEGNNENDRGSDNEHVSETSFAHENVDEFQVNPKPSCNTVISEDPFGIYKILKRNKDANVTEGDTHTPQYPPGFTPNVEENVVDNIPGNASQPKPNPTTSGNKEKASSVNDKFQASGSILEVMDELIKSLGMRMCPLSFSLCLDRASFNHRLIRLHELNVDYDLRLSSFPSGLPGRFISSGSAKSIGCSILHTPFNYLGVKVGGIMSRLSSWDDVIAKLSARLSKWKLKSLSIGGRLTLIKSVLSSLPLYYMSSFKVPKGVLSKMESIRRNFFNGVENAEKKMSLIGWNKILASKKNGGLDVSTIYGIRGALDNSSSYSRRSPWLDIVNEVRKLASKGIDLLSLVRKLGTIFFRRSPRSGIEEEQLLLLISNTSSVILPNISDRWSWLLDPSGDFSIKSTREFIDDSMLPKTDVPTRWVKSIPIKINIFAWRVSLDKLPTRGIFLSRPYIPSIIALICRIACGINFAPPFTLAQLASSS
ncbi:hypothetical protein Tco_1132291 [Tanacetum coccineum]|uniref:RNA-directed DNA polymerase, eukaryota n=1 Tax=Tanacetum coccineum TaxID=301880 RepID=A0ABQ5JCX1_9ASTR